MISFNKKYVFEDFIAEFDAFMKANLGTYIAQMNTDKPDITLLDIDPAAFYFQSLTSTEVPFKIFVFYGETNTAHVPMGPEGLDVYQLQVAIILENTNELQGVMGTRLLRYREVLKAMIRDGWNEVNKKVVLEVTGISPFPFSTTNQDNTHMGIGVTMDIRLT